MAQRPPTIEFEDVLLDEARRMSRGPRMDAELYHALKEKIQALNTTAARMSLSEGTSPTTMKNRILRVAVELKIPSRSAKSPEVSSSGAPQTNISSRPNRLLHNPPRPTTAASTPSPPASERITQHIDDTQFSRGRSPDDVPSIHHAARRIPFRISFFVALFLCLAAGAAFATAIGDQVELKAANRAGVPLHQEPRVRTTSSASRMAPEHT